MIPNSIMKMKKKAIKYFISLLNTPLNIETKKLKPSQILKKKQSFKNAKVIKMISSKTIALKETSLGLINSNMFSIIQNVIKEKSIMFQTFEKQPY